MQNIHDLKLLLNQKNNVNEMSPTRKSSDVETSPDVDMKTLELEMQESQGQTVFVATAKLVLVQRMKVFILS